LGTERKDFEIDFSEPWFLDRKLAFDVSLFHREASYLSINELYTEARTGARFALTRALWSDFFIGSVFYKIENVDINLEPGIHGLLLAPGGGVGPPGSGSVVIPPNAPHAILSEEGDTLLTRIGVSLARDTRNSTKLPDAGQRTELSAEWVSSYLGGERDCYKLGASTAWYCRGFAKGHVIEVAARTGVAEGLRGDDVPFYERYYLGGAYSLRGYEFRSVSPREPGFDEPVGGNTFWFGTIEYSIPIFQREKTGVRIAFFYDIGNVTEKAYDYNFSDYTDNWGVGLRLELPIGPLRLDYGVPIKHDDFQKDSGRFQFTAGWTRPL
jgi:outer membrane protein insertion porin family